MALLLRSINHFQTRFLKTTDVVQWIYSNSNKQLRRLVTKQKQQKIDQMKAEIRASWKPVYRNPFITPISLLVRFKIYHTFLTCIVSGATVYYYLDGSISETQLTMVAGALAIVLFLLIGYSILYQRVVGIVYLSKDSKSVRLAHLNFWGKRFDTSLPLNEIVPLSDSNPKRDTFHVKIARYDSKQVYYMNFGPKCIVNPQAFEFVFGYQPNRAFIDDNFKIESDRESNQENLSSEEQSNEVSKKLENVKK